MDKITAVKIGKEKIGDKEVLKERFLHGFRHLPEIENFYRFVYDNDLRHEAKILFKKVYEAVQKGKKNKKPKLS